MLRYEGLLTPYAQPRAIDASAMGDAGQMFEQIAQHQQARQDALAKQAQDAELERLATEGKNKYYDAQAATHRMAVEQAKGAIAEKRANALFDAFRKAKSPIERDMIRSELSRDGFTVEEGETDLPVSPQAPAAPAAVASAPMGKGKKGIFAATPARPGPLAPDLGPVPSDMGLDQKPWIDQANPENGVGGILGLMGFPQVAGISSAPGAASAGGAVSPDVVEKRGGKWLIKKDGVTVQSYDEPLEKMRVQMAMRSVLQPYMGAATNDRERAAAKAAEESAAQMVGGSSDPKDIAAAANYGLNVYKTVLAQEFKKTGVGGTGGVPGALSKTETARLNSAEAGTMRVIGNEATRNKVSALNSRAQEIENGESLLNAGGFGQTSAMLAWLKASTGRAPQAEFKALQGTQSLWGEIQQKVQKLDPNAPMSAEMIAEMRAAFGKTKAALEHDLDAVGESASEEVRQSLIPFKDKNEREGQAARARGAITGKFNAPSTQLADDLLKGH